MTVISLSLVFLLSAGISHQNQLLPNEVIDGNVTEFAALESELTYANIFKAADDWILRATSESDSVFTRLQIRIEGDRAVANYFLGSKLLSSPQLSHIANSKIIRMDVGGQADGRLIPLHQDHKILAYIKIGKDNRRTLRVAVNNGHKADDDCIRRLINNEFMAKPKTGDLIKDLLPTVRYINGDHPHVNYAVSGHPIGEDELIEPDLLKAVGNWTTIATSSKNYRHFSKARITLENNKAVVQMYNGQQHIGSAAMKYVKGSRVFAVDMFVGQSYDSAHVLLPYVDGGGFILLGYTKHEPAFLSIFAHDGYSFDTEYMKKVISNQMLFSPDIRRTISEMVKTMVWERT